MSVVGAGMWVWCLWPCGFETEFLGLRCVEGVGCAGWDRDQPGNDVVPARDKCG